ncbi:MAG: SAM-dependent methyltransferase [Planctomycetaceae bacterium]|nr:SAM-dependent methyltransferase [Planctomycetaceae bacterium]
MSSVQESSPVDITDVPLKRVLHVGCGPHNARKIDAQKFPSDAWKEVRLDIDASCEPDIVADICDLSMIESDSFDGLYSSHNIEHLYPQMVPVALQEFHRVLKPGGIARICCPDLHPVAEAIAKGNLEGQLFNTPAGPIAAIDVLYGWRPKLREGSYSWAHKTGFIRMTLAQKLKMAGFEKGQVWTRGSELVADVER